MLTISVETKRPDGDWDKAELQTGVWHSAHLRMLSAAAGRWILREAVAGAKEGPALAAAADAQPAVAAADVQEGPAPGTKDEDGYDLGRQDWLPGFIVQGHLWHFVATVRRGGVGKAPVGVLSNRPLRREWGKGPYHTNCVSQILLGSVVVGSTQNPLGIYSVLAAIRCIAAWAENKYWPAYLERVLDNE